VDKVYSLCRVKTNISAVLTVTSGLDPHMIIELEDELNRGPWLWLWLSWTMFMVVVIVDHVYGCGYAYAISFLFLLKWVLV
jgi:hypothetical protein